MAVTGSGAVQHVAVNISTATTTTVVTAVSGKAVRVLSYCLSLTGTTPTFKWQSSTGSTALSGLCENATVAQSVFSCNGTRDNPLMETAAGDSLQIVTAGTSPSLRGHVSYILQ